MGEAAEPLTPPFAARSALPLLNLLCVRRFPPDGARAAQSLLCLTSSQSSFVRSAPPPIGDGLEMSTAAAAAAAIVPAAALLSCCSPSQL